MHAEVADFLARAANILPSKHLGRVVEVGSHDVNGSARQVLDEFVGCTWDEWVGIDVRPGPGVDVVGEATSVLPGLPHGEYDLAVTTEVLEHTAEWRQILYSLCARLRPGGHLIVTCAGPGRPAHGVSGDPLPARGEHYANVSLLEVTELLAPVVSVLKGEEGPPGDTRVVARLDDQR